MAKDETASKRSVEVARANARYTINLQRAFNDLLPKLKRAYGRPAGDAADARSQHVLALLAISNFLARVGPTGDLAHFADRFVMLAQTLQDVNEGVVYRCSIPPLQSAAIKRWSGSHEPMSHSQ